MQNELKTFLEERYQSVLRGEVLDTRESDRILVNKVLEMVNVKIQNMFSNELNGETLISKYELLDEIKEIVK